MIVPLSRAREIRRNLLSWWDAGHRDLPWRFPQDAADPYRVWIAEVMLQQTRVSVVVPYYARFVERFPTLASLAAADEDDVLAQWSGLGYYARGRRLLAAAREAIALHGGLPSSPDALRALPGFGPYTAGAVASIAFAVRSPCVDGNVARVLQRLFLLPDTVTAEGRTAAWEIAGALVPSARPGDFNQALMELGATVCTPAKPSCARCPLTAACRARRAGRERSVAAPRARRAPLRVAVACAVVRRGEEVLLVRRPPGGLFGGLWGLPFAVVPRGEEGRQALARVVEEATGLVVRPARAVAAAERILTHRLLEMTAYDCGELTSSRRLRRGCRFHPLVESAMKPPLRRGPLCGGVATAMRALLDEVPRIGRNALTRQGVPV